MVLVRVFKPWEFLYWGKRSASAAQRNSQTFRLLQSRGYPMLPEGHSRIPDISENVDFSPFWIKKRCNKNKTLTVCSSVADFLAVIWLYFVSKMKTKVQNTWWKGSKIAQNFPRYYKKWKNPTSDSERALKNTHLKKKKSFFGRANFFFWTTNLDKMPYKNFQPDRSKTPYRALQCTVDLKGKGEICWRGGDEFTRDLSGACGAEIIACGAKIIAYGSKNPANLSILLKNHAFFERVNPRVNGACFSNVLRILSVIFAY